MRTRSKSTLRNKLLLSLLAALCTSAAPALAQSAAVPSLAQNTEAPRWIRYPAISPDGATIAFTFRGQIYIVPAEGGRASPVTSQGYFSHGAVWSPDSQRLAFASDVNGDDDIYSTDFTGALKRQTWSSVAEVPVSFSPNGQDLLYTSMRLGDAVASVQAPLSNLPQLYSLDMTTGRESLVLPNQADGAIWNSDHTLLLYARNPSSDPEARQHRVAANAREIWLYDAQQGVHTMLSDEAVDSYNPVWSSDETSVVFLSEQSGTLNVWRRDIKSAASVQLTQFSQYPVRDLSTSTAGDLVFSHNGAIYRIAAGASEPEPVEITIPEQTMEEVERFPAGAPTEFVSSPAGDYIATVIESDVFLIDRASGSTVKITDTPGQEKNVAFDPTGGTLAYAAQRDHGWGIYYVPLEDIPDGASFDEQPLVVNAGENAFQPAFSPDGSKLAYISDRREVKVLDLATQEIVSPFTPEDYNTSYGDGDLWFEWSPTSEDLLVQWRIVPFSAAIRAGIVPADGSSPVQPITTAISDIQSGVWSVDGTQIIALTTMYGLRNLDQSSLTGSLYRIFLSDAARLDFLDVYDGNPPPAMLTGDDSDESDPVMIPIRYALQHDRPQRLEGALSDGADYAQIAAMPDHKHLLAVEILDDGTVNMWAIDLLAGEKSLAGALQVPDARAVSIVANTGTVDIMSPKGVVTWSIADPTEPSSISVNVVQTKLASARRGAAFEQAWADIKYKFYRADTQGRDWEAIGNNYRAFLGSIVSERELADLIREMFGELSASHLFVQYTAPDSRESLPTATGMLGAYFDYSYDGPGRRVAAILPGGPLDRTGVEVGPGDIIAAVDGNLVPDAGGIDRLLNGDVAGTIILGVLDGNSGEARSVAVQPIDQFAEHDLSHTRWVDQRRAEVEQLSNACVVYQYVPEMDNAAQIGVFGRLIGSATTTRAALIDIRSNGGGNLHRQLIAMLTGKPFAQFGVEDRPWETEPTDRWQRPSAVLVDTYAYSDGSVFPQAYQDSAVGPLVGDTVLGTGTGVNYISSPLINGLVYGVPVAPFRRLDGSYYENREIEPDIRVPFDPNAAMRGEDPQLEAAVAALMQTIGADADCR